MYEDACMMRTHDSMNSRNILATDIKLAHIKGKGVKSEN